MRALALVLFFGIVFVWGAAAMIWPCEVKQGSGVFLGIPAMGCR